ncbi:MAG: hypothetical protein KatS3mg105_2069 [Gemmatales bacterium]|nr:MAG: hypothetical protein KatS3mg105_2069 [Gemmatales bacterium]
MHEKSTGTGERRRHVRHARLLDASWGGEPQDAGYFVRVLDISRGGVKLHLGAALEPGTLIAIKIYNDRGDAVAIDARVVHVREQDNGTWICGAAFISPLSQEDLDLLLMEGENEPPQGH